VYVELASLREPSLVLPTIAKTLGIEEPGTSADVLLRDQLAEARMLIVLDNMEQLAAAAGDLSNLLGSTESVQVLVTSRRILGIRAERVYSLEPLAVPADTAVTAAVELFLDRARSIRPSYQPSAKDLATFAQLSRRLDGLPLAIELAAAWLRMLSPQALLQQVGQQPLEFLREGAVDLPARQRTLRDTIAWSHSLLSADCKVLFARLAVFSGSADLGAIEQVTSSEGRLDILELIAELVDQSLVQALGEAAEPRFGMLELIREFAGEQLKASGTADDYRARHQTYYLELAERGNVGLGTASAVPCGARTQPAHCGWAERSPAIGTSVGQVVRGATGWSRSLGCRARRGTNGLWLGLSPPSKPFCWAISSRSRPAWTMLSRSPRRAKTGASWL
jgi:predicted ATPase